MSFSDASVLGGSVSGSESGIGVAFWYVLQVRSGMEKSIVENIKKIAEKRNVRNLFEDFNVPSIEIAKFGSVKPRQKILCSGYIFIKMIISEASMAVINRVSGTGAGSAISFLPKGHTPSPLTEAEYQDMLDTMMKSPNKKVEKPPFEMGMDVKITSGVFKDFKGTITKIDFEKSNLEISVSVFHRETTVDVNFSDVEIIK